MKKIFIPMFVFTMLICISIGSKDSEATPKAFDNFQRPRIITEKLKVGYLHGHNDAESQIRSVRQADIEVVHRGWEIIHAAFDNDQQARDMFMNLINQNVDVILLGAMASMPSKADLVIRARKKGIGVYNNDNQVIEGIISNSTMPNGVAAMELLYKIGEDRMWKGNIGILEGKAFNLFVERLEPIKSLLGTAYPNFKLLAVDDLGTSNPTLEGYNIAKRWMQKYGAKMDIIIGGCDDPAISAAEAIKQSGDPNGKNTVTAGLDGGSKAWTYIRNNTPFKYSYAQPFELYTHNCFEIIQQIQVKGLNPGDKGCMINRVGGVVYARGKVVAPYNVPNVGETVHAVFGYYGLNPNNSEAWYNWKDAKGTYMIQAGESN